MLTLAGATGGVVSAVTETRLTVVGACKRTRKVRRLQLS